MKKTIRMLLLLFVLLLVLPTFACGDALRISKPVPTPTLLPTPTLTPEPTVVPLTVTRPDQKSSLLCFVPGSLKAGGGYYSTTFNISIDLPEGWTEVDKDTIHLLNAIEADPSDSNALRDAYQAKLQQDSSALEYFASREKPSGYMIVVAAEMLDADGAQATEMDVLAEEQYWLLDTDHDGTIDVDNLRWVVVDAFGGKHMSYQFSGFSGGTQTEGILLAYKRGSLFEVVLLTSDVKGDIENILQGMRDGF